MTLKIFLTICCLCALASHAYCRNIQSTRSQFYERNSETDLVAEESKAKIQSRHQGRVFPGAGIVAKKLLLLKFKTLAPIKFLLLRSENGEEAELVPIYETSFIPSDVKVIGTPGGLTGHEDVQAIAIPAELANKNDISQALQIVTGSKDKQQIIRVPTEEEQLLDTNEDDEQQILVDAVQAPALRSSFFGNTKENSPFEESSLYLYPYEEKTGKKHSHHTRNRYFN